MSGRSAVAAAALSLGAFAGPSGALDLEYPHSGADSLCLLGVVAVPRA